MAAVKHENFTDAFAAAQMEFVPVKKNRTAIVKTKAGGQYTYKYADLGDVLSMCLPIFARHGIAVSQPLKIITTPTGSELRLITEFYWGESTIPALKSDGLCISEELDPQDFGGVHSYWRRYDLCSLGGIAPEEDIDGRTSTGETKSDRQARGNEQPQQGPLLKEFRGKSLDAKRGQADSGPFIRFNLHNEENSFVCFTESLFKTIETEGLTLSGAAEVKRDSKGTIWYKVTKLESDEKAVVPGLATPVEDPRGMKEILAGLFPTPKELKYKRLIETAIQKEPSELHMLIVKSFEGRVKRETPNGELGLLSALDISIQEAREEFAVNQAEGENDYDNPSDYEA